MAVDMSSKQRPCNQCKWSDQGACTRNREKYGTGAVYGEKFRFEVREYCILERDSPLPGKCGKNGLHFEPRW